MPYDPRPVSDGGNRRLNDKFYKEAPPGKFKVVGVDTFDGTDWIVDYFDTLDEAQRVADELGGVMTKMYVYDEKGRLRGEAGTF